MTGPRQTQSCKVQILNNVNFKEFAVTWIRGIDVELCYNETS